MSLVLMPRRESDSGKSDAAETEKVAARLWWLADPFLSFPVTRGRQSISPVTQWRSFFSRRRSSTT